MLGRETGSARASWLAAAALCLPLLACQQPLVGERDNGAATRTGAKIVLEDAWLDLHGHVVATFAVTEEEVPLSAAEVMSLAPRFTLATLKEHPVDGFAAWKSQLATGKQVAPRLPPGGPGTPDPDVLTSVRQPGYEAPATAASLVDLGDGRFRYVFASPLAEFVPDETVRVGVWLAKAEEPTELTTSTFDFSPMSGPLDPTVNDRVLESNCRQCHHLVESTSGATGVRICVTCHTWQHTDPDTVDPAQIVTTGISPSTDPNPLEFGRMIHRVHRGKDLPTIYTSYWDGVNLTTVPAPGGLPAPYVQNKPGNPVHNPLAGRKYSVIGSDGREVVFARAVTLQTFDPTIVNASGLPVTMLLAEGGMFPRDLRDCEVCHGGGARQGWVTTFHVSRRTCSGCHPEVWFQATAPRGDPVRLPHAGGPQADDAQCAGCHVAGGAKVYAPIHDAHVPPARHKRYSKPAIKILRVEGLTPGQQPAITFKISDRVGGIAPRPNAPTPAWEPEGLVTSLEDPQGLYTSYVPRKLTALSFRIVGPTTPDYSLYSGLEILSGAPNNPDPLALTALTPDGEYLYTFTQAIPAGTTGTFAVGTEVRRNVTLAFYNKTKDIFLWPFTGEPVNETAENVIVYVNSATGIWPPRAGDPPPVPRRTVVELQNCLRCHDRIEFHSGQKHDVAWCITCHTYDNTDIAKRLVAAGRLYPGGPVRIGATFDGVEERSTHFKTMIHRIHTGSREGAASLEAIRPYALYYSKAYFFDRGGFPNDLRNCTLCHSGKSYLVESIPADAPATRGNEQPTVWHANGTYTHLPEEPALLPIQAACTGCHATGATFAHVANMTVNGVETCGQCHSKGPRSVEVAHGLAPPSGGVASSFSAILSEILVPRCATAACHSGPPPQPPPQLDASSAYGALVDRPATQSQLMFVKPGFPEQSYLVYKLRGDAAGGGGSVLTPMPPDGLLDPADIAAIEAWIANGAPND